MACEKAIRKITTESKWCVRSQSCNEAFSPRMCDTSSTTFAVSAANRSIGWPGALAVAQVKGGESNDKHTQKSACMIRNCGSLCRTSLLKDSVRSTQYFLQLAALAISVSSEYFCVCTGMDCQRCGSPTHHREHMQQYRKISR